MYMNSMHGRYSFQCCNVTNNTPWKSLELIAIKAFRTHFQNFENAPCKTYDYTTDLRKTFVSHDNFVTAIPCHLAVFTDNYLMMTYPPKIRRICQLRNCLYFHSKTCRLHFITNNNQLIEYLFIVDIKSSWLLYSNSVSLWVWISG